MKDTEAHHTFIGLSLFILMLGSLGWKYYRSRKRSPLRVQGWGSLCSPSFSFSAGSGGLPSTACPCRGRGSLLLVGSAASVLGYEPGAISEVQARIL